MPNKPATPCTCDIFCNVIDNYGDVGVCWRLARLLANEHGLTVRLWVDDLASFAMLCHEADAATERQKCRGVEVCLWSEPFPEVQPAELVIEAFACKLPESYLAAMAAQAHKPTWINLEYLSAEDWVEGHHKLPSPHSVLPLTKYFFFPGFTEKTGGLLLEQDLLARRDDFYNDAARQQAFWQSINMQAPAPGTLKVSLFCYENASLGALFDAWTSGSQSVLCLIPEGRILPQIGRYFGDAAPGAGADYVHGSLQVRVLPFVEQERYDELLWACDVNFVRGEDSFVRAQWAGKPFIWQIYPQHDKVHLKKLEAFLILYCEQLGDHASLAIHGLWQAWNGGCDTLLAKPADCGSIREADSRLSAESLQTWRGGRESRAGQAWSAFMAARGDLGRHAQNWARHMALNELALNLLDFHREIGRMRAFEIEGQ